MNRAQEQSEGQSGGGWILGACVCWFAAFSVRCVIANEDFVTNYDVTITAVAVIAT